MFEPFTQRDEDLFSRVQGSIWKNRWSLLSGNLKDSTISGRSVETGCPGDRTSSSEDMAEVK